MWESALSISIFAPPLWVTAGSYAACFVPSIFPAVFELDWTDVFQDRMHACPVVPEQPIKHHILGLADGFQVLAVQPLHLQRSEQRFGHRIVPTVALAAHRSQDAVLFHNFAKVLAGILTAPIRVKDQSPRLWTALIDTHLQRVDD